MIVLELYELKNICMEMAELGAAANDRRKSPANDLISQREAYRLFGEARVKRWVKINLVNHFRSGATIRSKVMYSKLELLSADKSEKFNSIINK